MSFNRRYTKTVNYDHGSHSRTGSVPTLNLFVDSLQTLHVVVHRIYENALMKPDSCEMCASLCASLSLELPDFVENGKRITFKRILVNMCQDEFERKQSDQVSVVKQSEEGREEERVEARRRMMGNIRFIGELFKKKMLTEWIMHGCIEKLLGQHRTVDEEDIEALCILMSTVGEVIDHPKSKEKMEVYFEKMRNLSNNIELSSSVRVTLKDLIDLRENNWKLRRKVKGQKMINKQVHRSSPQEGQPSRGTSFNQSRRSNGPMRYQPLGVGEINRDVTKVLSVQELEVKSREVIKEFYCCRDDREVSFCIKELNTPSFHPTMISTWVTDSFEEKDTQRDLLAKLLVDLTASNNATINPTQLVKGFESVLEVLEDFTVNVPRSPNYLSRILAKVVAERVVPLRDIAHIIFAGGEEPGSLLNSGIAGEILGSMLNIIKSEKGNDVSNELVKGARLRLRNFLPPVPQESEALEKFIYGL